MAIQCTKFEVSSLSRSRDILKGVKFKMGQATWSRPLQRQFVIRRLGLAMFNPHTKFEVSMFINYKHMKGNAKCSNWVVLGLQVTLGHRQRMTSCSTLIETMRLSCTVSSYSELFVNSRRF